jgi:hypothetical protein
MKQAELRKHVDCTHCGQKVLANGVPLFWRVTVERFGVDLNAIRRAAGFEQMLGSPALAAVMGCDEDMAKPMMDTAVITVCDSCACSALCIAQLVMS